MYFVNFDGSKIIKIKPCSHDTAGHSHTTEYIKTCRDVTVLSNPPCTGTFFSYT